MRLVVQQTRDPEKYIAVPDTPKSALMEEKSVLELFKRWMEEQGAKVSKKTGQPRARTTLTNFNSTYEKLRGFEEIQGHALCLVEMDLRRFYEPFWRWFTQDLGQSINTFGKHVTRLRNFLSWCEDYDLKVNRQYRQFEAPSLYVGVDALTEEELRAIAALDFLGSQIQGKLHYAYSAKQGSELDSPEFQAHVAEVELARDKFLECAYSSMHISDADAALRANIKRVPGVEDRVLEVLRAKNQNPC